MGVAATGVAGWDLLELEEGGVGGVVTVLPPAEKWSVLLEDSNYMNITKIKILNYWIHETHLSVSDIEVFLHCSQLLSFCFKLSEGDKVRN